MFPEPHVGQKQGVHTRGKKRKLPTDWKCPIADSQATVEVGIGGLAAASSVAGGQTSACGPSLPIRSSIEPSRTLLLLYVMYCVYRGWKKKSVQMESVGREAQLGMRLCTL